MAAKNTGKATGRERKKGAAPSPSGGVHPARASHPAPVISGTGTGRGAPKGNAAIWYAADGYDPGVKGINGRRVAGESFLRGFLAHGEVDEFVALAHGIADEKRFQAFAAAQGVTRPVRTVPLLQQPAMAPVDVVSYPSPNMATECWRRAALSPDTHAAWAICGITHTTATKAVMQGMYDMRAAPQMPWDAVICTSQAVKQSIVSQMELTERHLETRFGGRVPDRPLLPVIPLGVNCDDHLRDRSAGQALRSQLGIGPEDVACAIIARLTPHEKFDPLPLFIAMAEAQARLGPVERSRLHLMLCGQFTNAKARDVFVRGAAALMPDVGLHLLNGGLAAARKATLSAADMFLFPIDNVQETFGLAPIEAMAAGLPVVVSDWDGMRDTVVQGTGFRIPTEMGQSPLSIHLGLRYFGGSDNYGQYLSQLSAVTRIDIAKMAEAIHALARSPDLRARMGAAAARHARSHYDWRAVIPIYQALWAEQSAMLAVARMRGDAPRACGVAQLPPAPPPGVFFRDYPSRFGPASARRYRLRSGRGVPAVDPLGAIEIRDYRSLQRMFEAPERVLAVHEALGGAGAAGLVPAALVAATGLPERAVMRVLLWLMKYGYAEESN